MRCVQFVTIVLYACIYELHMYLLIYINLCYRFPEDNETSPGRIEELIYTFHLLYVRLLVCIINDQSCFMLLTLDNVT
jgi:hypothetical protein